MFIYKYSACRLCNMTFAKRSLGNMHYEQSDGIFVLSECGSRAFAFLTSWVVHFWFKWTWKLVRKNVTHHMWNICWMCVFVAGKTCKSAFSYQHIAKRSKFKFAWSVAVFCFQKSYSTYVYSFTRDVFVCRVHIKYEKSVLSSGKSKNICPKAGNPPAIANTCKVNWKFAIKELFIGNINEM